MQKPITPTPSLVTASLDARKSIAAPIFEAAWPMLSDIMSLPASSGSVVVRPP